MVRRVGVVFKDYLIGASLVIWVFRFSAGAVELSLSANTPSLSLDRIYLGNDGFLKGVLRQLFIMLARRYGKTCVGRSAEVYPKISVSK